MVISPHVIISEEVVFQNNHKVWRKQMIERRKALILLNASAGTGRAGLNTWTIIKKFAENGYESIVYPIIPGTDLVGETLVTRYEGTVDIILCSGGDGTLNHVIQGVMRMKKKPRIAYLPSGSTNDFAKTLGIPAEFDKALDLIIRGKEYLYDVGKLNGSYFNYVAAFGAFSAISYDTDQQLKNILGHAAYIVNAVSDLYENMRFSRHIRIESDDFSLEDDFIFGAVCNSAYVGGFSIFKNLDVSLDDGKMEMLLIKTPGTAADMQGILNAFQRGTFDHPFITFRHISKVRFSSSEAIAWTIDGEFGGSFTDAEILVECQAVPIILGNS